MLCDKGFAIDKKYMAIPFICNMKGFWEPRWQGSKNNVAKCYRIRCPTPPQRLASGAVLLDSSDFYRYEDVIRYTCPRGKWNAPNGYGITITSTCSAQRILNASLQSPAYVARWNPGWDNFECSDLQCQHPGKLYLE